MDLGDKRTLFINSKTLLEEIEKTSAMEVLSKMRQSFETDDWSEDLKLQAISVYSITVMGILTPCAVANNDILEVFAKGVDDNKTLIHFMYPAIAQAFDDAAEKEEN